MLSLVGLTVTDDKYKLFKNSVTFLGFKIYKERLHVPEIRIKSITLVLIPQNVTELKNFFMAGYLL